MDIIDQRLLREIADLEKVPQGAYNIRKNGKLEGRSNSANIVIESKTDKPGIDIRIAPGTKNLSEIQFSFLLILTIVYFSFK